MADSLLADGVPVPGFSPNGKRYSPLEYLLRETEQLHGKIRRFTSPDEHPFYPETLPALVLPPITYAEVRHMASWCACSAEQGPTGTTVQVLAPYSKEVNVNARVMEMYVGHLLPNIAAPGDDNNYGSSAMYDVLALQVSAERDGHSHSLGRPSHCWPAMLQHDTGALVHPVCKYGAAVRRLYRRGSITASLWPRPSSWRSGRSTPS